MRELTQSGSTPRAQLATVRAAGVAGDQWGAIGYRQLRDCGLGKTTITRWCSTGRLHLVFPGVYAYGHPALPIEGRLAAALLYAGDEAVLSHRTAAWWWGLIDSPPCRIELSRLARTVSLPEILVHQPRRLDATRHRRFPITTVARTLLDYAAGASLSEVRLALAKADYLERLDVHAVNARLGRGHPGAAKLRAGLKRHQPVLAHTRSRTERAFIPLCERARVAIPEVNVPLHGWTVDFLWREQGLVVEVDGHGNHRTAAQLDRDHRKDLTLRSNGLTVNRYSRSQVEDDGAVVIADVERTLDALSASRTGRSA
jgi:Protein of unknown function (DUF559)